ncbi:MAG: hypothetical protein WBC91_15250 [Phototrophicaceae bacterium]
MKQQQQQRTYLYVGGILVAVIIVGLFFINQNGGLGSIPLRDIHGISFTPTGELYAATHDGLIRYDDGWTVPDVAANDYMGYSGTADGFYSSGHPGATTGLTNPLGLVRSTDGGETLSMLAFLGESDFHTMAASYRVNVVYVYNAYPNSELQQGLYYTLDDGQTWMSSNAMGLAGTPISLAVHPNDSSTVAVTTERGVYLSTDYGSSFQSIAMGASMASSFDTDAGTTLYFSGDYLMQYNLADGLTTELALPALSASEVITAIAVNPMNGELALATSERDIYLANQGAWRQIATNGYSS